MLLFVFLDGFVEFLEIIDFADFPGAIFELNHADFQFIVGTCSFVTKLQGDDGGAVALLR